jgi:hypothetical protein
MYATLTIAAYIRELLCELDPEDITLPPTAFMVPRDGYPRLSGKNFKYQTLKERIPGDDLLRGTSITGIRSGAFLSGAGFAF